MKAVLLAGGLGTRLSEETGTRPKPMVEIGGRPILWHIMKIYAAHGVREFVICLGYKGYMIKEYFFNYHSHMSDLTVNLKTGETTVHQSNSEDWKVTLVDTGENTMTGGRITRIKDYVKGEDSFFLTYGDGVANVDIGKLAAFHKGHGKLATLTAALPPGRFGALDIDASKCVRDFKEKPKGDGSYINGGFFVLSPKAIDYIKEGDATFWEREPLETLANDGELMAFQHDGFWQPMDTLRDKNHLESLWSSGKAPWKVW